jgi:hypothetical protein
VRVLDHCFVAGDDEDCAVSDCVTRQEYFDPAKVASASRGVSAESLSQSHSAQCALYWSPVCSNDSTEFLHDGQAYAARSGRYDGSSTDSSRAARAGAEEVTTAVTEELRAVRQDLAAIARAYLATADGEQRVQYRAQLYVVLVQQLSHWNRSFAGAA